MGFIKELLVFLKEANFACCIMSNGELETLHNAVSNNKIDRYINQIFSASQVEKYKVSPLVYRMATAHFNTGPAKIYFVSSNSWDISGAQHFGYKTIWVNRTEKVFDSLVDSPDHIVNSLEDITKIINQPNS